ncbi:MAG: type II toxin-antitoxin system RelE/ParE family toxin [Methylobacter sp.]
MVIWSNVAKTDLRAIFDYIANDSKHYAKKVAQDFREKTDILDELPLLGRVGPETEDKMFGNYRFILIALFTKSKMITFIF